jgi:hypothetical protein
MPREVRVLLRERLRERALVLAPRERAALHEVRVQLAGSVGGRELAAMAVVDREEGLRAASRVRRGRGRGRFGVPGGRAEHVRVFLVRPAADGLGRAVVDDAGGRGGGRTWGMCAAERPGPPAEGESRARRVRAGGPFEDGSAAGGGRSSRRSRNYRGDVRRRMAAVRRRVARVVGRRFADVIGGRITCVIGRWITGTIRGRIPGLVRRGLPGVIGRRIPSTVIRRRRRLLLLTGGVGRRVAHTVRRTRRVTRGVRRGLARVVSSTRAAVMAYWVVCLRQGPAADVGRREGQCRRMADLVAVGVRERRRWEGRRGHRSRRGRVWKK